MMGAVHGTATIRRWRRGHCRLRRAHSHASRSLCEPACRQLCCPLELRQLRQLCCPLEHHRYGPSCRQQVASPASRRSAPLPSGSHPTCRLTRHTTPWRSHSCSAMPTHRPYRPSTLESRPPHEMWTMTTMGSSMLSSSMRVLRERTRLCGQPSKPHRPNASFSQCSGWSIITTTQRAKRTQSRLVVLMGPGMVAGSARGTTQHSSGFLVGSSSSSR